jgi:hypothetical protein
VIESCEGHAPMTQELSARWHTVRFVDEPVAPHSQSRTLIRQWWNDFRGKAVKIRRHYSREEVLAFSGTVGRMEGCDCQDFFEVGGFKDFGNPGRVPLACRRMLEMD